MVRISYDAHHSRLGFLFRQKCGAAAAAAANALLAHTHTEGVFAEQIRNKKKQIQTIAKTTVGEMETQSSGACRMRHTCLSVYVCVFVSVCRYGCV